MFTKFDKALESVSLAEAGEMVAFLSLVELDVWGWKTEQNSTWYLHALNSCAAWNACHWDSCVFCTAILYKYITDGLHVGLYPVLAYLLVICIGLYRHISSKSGMYYCLRCVLIWHVGLPLLDGVPHLHQSWISTWFGICIRTHNNIR